MTPKSSSALILVDAAMLQTSSMLGDYAAKHKRVSATFVAIVIYGACLVDNGSLPSILLDYRISLDEAVVYASHIEI